MDYFAHSGAFSDFRDWQPLAAHLQNVAELAQRFATETEVRDIGLEDAAYLSGLLHDVGKYRKGFQDYIPSWDPPREERLNKQAGVAR